MERPCWNFGTEKSYSPISIDRRLIEQVLTEVAIHRDVVTVVQVCRYRRCYYYQPTPVQPGINEYPAAWVKRVITGQPCTGYRRITWGCWAKTKNTNKGFFQLLDSTQLPQQCSTTGAYLVVGSITPKWTLGNGYRERISSRSSVILCSTGVLWWLWWTATLSSSGNAKVAETALEEALITRYGTLVVTRPDYSA